MEDKRKFARLDINVGVHWKKLKSEQGEDLVVLDVSKNISRVGICLVTYSLLAKGDQISIEFALPSNRIVLAKGRVVRVRELEMLGRKDQKKYEIGVEFLEIDERDQEEIRRFETNPYTYTA